jgi:hypothetical protein
MTELSIKPGAKNSRGKNRNKAAFGNGTNSIEVKAHQIIL